ncbi:MAG: ribosome biogenesis GTP-binding protein YihA/YsxC [Ignavibacteria bacterium]|jgi:GTP-binding protein|nr:ribosome biogenesis GTP-binding protein YihA/YsxC [Ignavibacteria bacterium]
MNDEIVFYREITDIKNLPKEDLPHIVFSGRSNVGKSSVINTLYKKKNLAKTSSTPGKTRALNFYNVNNKYYLVDLPGFGYAKASKTEQEKWKKLISNYFSSCQHIRSVVQIIDSRHEPSVLDLQMFDFVKHYNVTHILLLNKVDKLKQSQMAHAKKMFAAHFTDFVFEENIFFFSAIDGTGSKNLMKIIRELI